MILILLQQVDKVTGRFNGQFKTYAICGAIRRMVSILDMAHLGFWRIMESGVLHCFSGLTESICCRIG